MKWIEQIVFQKVPETPFLAKYLATRGLKMRLGTRKRTGVKKTPPKKINAWYELNWVNSFSKLFGNPIFGQIFVHQRAENETMSTKIDRGQETYIIRVNARYEMNWANSFLKKIRKPCWQMDGQRDGWTDGETDGQTSGWIQYTPIPLSVEPGYKD